MFEQSIKPPEPYRVMVVEDQEVIRMGLCHFIGRLEGYELVGEFSNGQDAVDAMAVLKPHVVLTDISMPIMSGIEATRIIKSQWPDVKVILFTFWDDDQTLIEGLSSGADGFCTKNLGCKELERVLGWVLRARLWVAPQLAKALLQWANLIKESRQSLETQTKIEFDPYRITPEWDMSPQETQCLELLAKESEKTHHSDFYDQLNPDWIQEHLQAILKKMSQRPQIVDINQIRLLKQLHYHP